MISKDIKTLASVQMLRFVAALIVVLNHVNARMLAQGERYGFVPVDFSFDGGFGVRVFFVISGFIMVWICFRPGADDPKPWPFLRNRIIRIVPLYWTLTLLYLFYTLGAASVGDPVSESKLDASYIAKSFLFIPELWEGKHRPLLDVGWTLNHEMFFYALFGLALFLPRYYGAILLAVVLTALTAVSHILPAPFSIWADPIILYFVAGMALAGVRIWWLRSGFELPSIGWLAPVAAVAALIAGALPLGHLTIVAASVIVAACVLTQDYKGGALANVAVRLGDASYSIYLVHGFALLGVGIVWRKVFGGDFVYFFGITEVVASLILGWLTYRYVEQRLTRLFRSKSKKLELQTASA